MKTFKTKNKSTMKTLLTLILSILFALTASAQETITVNADNAAKILSELKPGEYNLVVKGNLKDIVKYDESRFPLTNWRIDNSVTINTLDLSQSYGVDTIMGVWIYHEIPMDIENLDGSIETKQIMATISPKKIVLPNDVKYVYCVADEFQVSPKNEIFSTKNGWLLSKNGKILICPKRGRQIIPDGVEIISDEIFKEDDTIEVPKSVKVLGLNNYNPNWIISSDNPFFCVEDGMLYNKDKSILLYAQTAKDVVKIPNGVKKIGYKAFERTGYLDSVIMSNTVEVIDSFAFLHTGVNRMIISNSVKRIENKAFYGCNPTEMTMSNSIEYIGSYAGITDCGGTIWGYVQCPNTLKFVGKNAGNIELEDPYDWCMTFDENNWLNRKNGVPLNKIVYCGRDSASMGKFERKPHKLNKLTNILINDGIELTDIENWKEIFPLLGISFEDREKMLKIKDIVEKDSVDIFNDDYWSNNARIKAVIGDSKIEYGLQGYNVEYKDGKRKEIHTATFRAYPYYYKLD